MDRELRQLLEVSRQKRAEEARALEEAARRAAEQAALSSPDDDGPGDAARDALDRLGVCHRRPAELLDNATHARPPWNPSQDSCRGPRAGIASGVGSAV